MGRTRKLVLLLHQLANEKPIPAEISSLDELSGHADQHELVHWIEPLAPALRRVFLVHGEPRQAETLARLLHSTHGLEVVVPAPGQSFELN